MNPGPILIIINIFQTLFLALLFSALIKTKNTIAYLLSCNHITKPKNTFTIFFSCIIVLFYFIGSYLFYCIYYLFLLTFNTLCLTTTRWIWGRKTRRLFCRLPDENKERFFDCSPRVRYKSWVSSRGENLLLLQHFALGVPTKWHIA
jgi:hypothetical protein